MKTSAELLERWGGTGGQRAPKGGSASEPNRWALWVRIPDAYLGPTVYLVEGLGSQSVVRLDTTGMT